MRTYHTFSIILAWELSARNHKNGDMVLRRNDLGNFTHEIARHKKLAKK